MGIRSIMVLGIASLLVLAGTTAAYITVKAVHREAIDRVTIAQRHYVQLLGHALKSSDETDTGIRAFVAFKRRSDLVHLQILDRTLRRLDTPKHNRAPAVARVLDAFRTGQGERLILGDETIQYYSRRVRLMDGRDVVLDVGFDLQAVETSLAMRQRIVLVYLLVSFAAVLIFGVYLSRRVLVLPLRRLTSMADTIQVHQTGPNRLSEIRGPTEIRQLADALGALLSRLGEKNDDLKANMVALQNAQAELLHAEQLAAVGRLSAGVAHEIGNPLAAALGFVEFLKTSDGIDSMTADLCGRIERELLRIQATLRHLLDGSRPSTGQLSRVSLTDLIQSTLGRLRHHRKMSGIEIKLDGNDVELTIETQKFHQVLSNLILNAADAMSGRGRISIELMEEADAHVVEISDEGPGISEENCVQVFEPFWSSKPHGSGTGLGLSISKRLMADMGGELVLRAPMENRGATFALVLPKASEKLESV